MKTKNYIYLIPLILCIALPLALRPKLKREADAKIETGDKLIIITPHNESIRHEFGNAFKKHMLENYSKEVSIDWRSPGGTSEIVRYIKSSYIASFKYLYTREGNNWSAANSANLFNYYLNEDQPELLKARQEFLNSNTSIDIDIFFGGGQYDYGKMSKQGILVDSGLRERHPELFSSTSPILEQAKGGETWYDKKGNYFGACFSSFGICSNTDRLQELKHPNAIKGLQQWSELGDYSLFRQTGVADPSKSGSITKCFEMLVQQQMALTIAQNPDLPLEKQLELGWQEAMNLIKRIGGNAKYFTFSAGKIPSDVAEGSIAAGMCIDFYGRSQAEYSFGNQPHQPMIYVTPVGGSSVSCDPIAIFRGAPNREIAEHFIDFVFSRPGQQLWNYKTGTQGGPEKYAIRRLPVRKDLYTKEDRMNMSDPEADPFILADNFIYHPEWTASLFGMLRLYIRVMIIDCHEELSSAWVAINETEPSSEAVEAFYALPFPFSECKSIAKELRSPEDSVKLCREWQAFFREHYTKAEKLSK